MFELNNIDFFNLFMLPRAYIYFILRAGTTAPDRIPERPI